jgi:hypothetical protein
LLDQAQQIRAQQLAVERMKEEWKSRIELRKRSYCHSWREALLMPAETVLLLAQMMIGEAGVLGPDAMIAVCSVAENRLTSDWFPDTMIDVLEKGFYARGPVTERHLRLARECLDLPDTTGGMLFAISEQDRLKLRCEPGDEIYSRGRYRMHLYRGWCTTGETDGHLS